MCTAAIDDFCWRHRWDIIKTILLLISAVALIYAGYTAPGQKLLSQLWIITLTIWQGLSSGISYLANQCILTASAATDKAIATSAIVMDRSRFYFTSGTPPAETADSSQRPIESTLHNMVARFQNYAVWTVESYTPWIVAVVSIGSFAVLMKQAHQRGLLRWLPSWTIDFVRAVRYCIVEIIAPSAIDALRPCTHLVRFITIIGTVLGGVLLHALLGDHSPIFYIWPMLQRLLDLAVDYSKTKGFGVCLLAVYGSQYLFWPSMGRAWTESLAAMKCCGSVIWNGLKETLFAVVRFVFGILRMFWDGAISLLVWLGSVPVDRVRDMVFQGIITVTIWWLTWKFFGESTRLTLKVQYPEDMSAPRLVY